MNRSNAPRVGGCVVHSQEGDSGCVVSLSALPNVFVGRERRERISQLAWCGGGCSDSRRRVNPTVGWLVLNQSSWVSSCRWPRNPQSLCVLAPWRLSLTRHARRTQEKSLLVKVDSDRRRLAGVRALLRK